MSHQHPRRDVITSLEDYTVPAEKHTIRYGWREGDLRTMQSRYKYTESIYNTATDKNIVITSDGSSYTILRKQK